MPGATRSERHVVDHAEVREQQRVLRQQRGAACVGWPPDVEVEVEQHIVVEGRPPGVRPQDPGDDLKHRRLAGTVGPEDRNDLTRGDLQRDVQVAVGHHRIEVERHSALLREPRTSPMTRTAMTTRTNDRATAASGSLSRCR